MSVKGTYDNDDMRKINYFQHDALGKLDECLHAKGNGKVLQT